MPIIAFAKFTFSILQVQVERWIPIMFQNLNNFLLVPLEPKWSSQWCKRSPIHRHGITLPVSRMLGWNHSSRKYNGEWSWSVSPPRLNNLAAPYYQVFRFLNRTGGKGQLSTKLCLIKSPKSGFAFRVHTRVMGNYHYRTRIMGRSAGVIEVSRML